MLVRPEPDCVVCSNRLLLHATTTACTQLLSQTGQLTAATQPSIRSAGCRAASSVQHAADHTALSQLQLHVRASTISSCRGMSCQACYSCGASYSSHTSSYSNGGSSSNSSSREQVSHCPTREL